MATTSAARIRSLCRRHNHADETVYHFSANPVQHVVTGFSRPALPKPRHPLRPTNASALLFGARWRKRDSPDSVSRHFSIQLTGDNPHAVSSQFGSRYDPFFLPPGAEAFKRDNPTAELHLFNTGHFALEAHAEEIAETIRKFLARRLAAVDGRKKSAAQRFLLQSGV